MRAYQPKGLKHPVLISDNKKLKPWRQEIAGMADTIMQEKGFTCMKRKIAVVVEAIFFFAKPKSVPKKVLSKTTKPDVDKLARATLDAVTGIVFEDDSQVTDLITRKRFGMPERMNVHIYKAEED